tara:strand:+ start:17529 stop:18905 length:1377 start_codon:yes stop_codon:yes gene_type:complete
MDIIEYEKYILKQLFTNKEARDKIYPFLDPVYFEDDVNNRSIVQEYIKHYEEYKDYPTAREFAARLSNEDTFNKFKDIINYDTSDLSEEFLQDQATEFFKQKMIMSNTLEIVENMKNKGADSIADINQKIRDALSFSFDTEIGLDFLEDGERLYNGLHEDDTVISTGLTDVDNMIKGGFHEKTLTLFIAPTNMGKSLIKCAVGVNAMLQNKKVLYVTLEMSEEKTAERVMANAFDVPISQLDQMNKETFMKIYNKGRDKISGKLVIKEYPTKGANTNSIKSLLKELDIKKKFIPDIIFVDYLGIMTTNSRMTDANTNTQFKTISEELRGLAVETGIPIVSANQTNRDGMNANDLDLTDVADSIGQTMTADIIIGVTQTEEMNEQGLYSFKVMKNRYGGRYSKCFVKVDYSKMRLSDAPNQEELAEADLDSTTSEATTAVMGAMKFNRREKRKNTIDFD